MSGVEVLSAVAAASQLIAYTSNILSLVREVHDAHKKAACHSNDIEVVTKDLLRLSVKLKSAPQMQDPELAELCGGATDVGNELMRALHALKVQGPNTTWKSFRSALRNVMGKSKLLDIENRLGAFRDTMNLRVLINFR